MPGNVQSDTGGQPIYELNVKPPQETTSAFTEQKIEHKTAKGYDSEDIEKYGIARPVREKIYAKIVRQEWQKICTTSEETKTTE